MTGAHRRSRSHAFWTWLVAVVNAAWLSVLGVTVLVDGSASPDRLLGSDATVAAPSETPVEVAPSEVATSEAPSPSETPTEAPSPEAGPSEIPTAVLEPEPDPLDLLLPRSWSRPAVGGVHAYRRGAYPIRDMNVDLRAPVDWRALASLGRGERRLIHVLLPLRDLAVAADGATVTGRARMAADAMALVKSWWAANGRNDPSDAMAWHDETTAKRALSLLLAREQFRHVLSRSDRVLLHEILGAHADALADPAFHSTGNNHGMLQDVALLAWSASSRTAITSGPRQELALDRIRTYLDQVVASDGAHLEHSPGYHFLVAKNLGRLVDYLEAQGVEDRGLEQVFERMRSYSTHIIQPDGTLPLIGDTFAGVSARNLWDDPGILWARSGGSTGTPPEETAVVYQQAGYAIFRDSWTDTRAYMHFTAAYHGDYHKHSDDLSVWYWLDGELLTEAGPNGYDYDEPDTRFAYSSAAHNTMLVDGRGLRRVDGRWGDTTLVGGSTDGDVAVTTGRTTRHRGVSHEREVRLDRTALKLTVTDRVEVEGRRNLTFLWHLAPGVTAVEHPAGIELQRDGSPVALLSVRGADARIEEPGVGSLSLRLGGDRTPTGKIVCDVVADGSVEVVHEVVPF